MIRVTVTLNPHPQVAATQFLALMAYPELDTVAYRRKLFVAFMARADFDVAKKCSPGRLQWRDVDRTLAKAERIIRQRRIPAAMAAIEMQIKHAFEETVIQFHFEDRVTELGTRFAKHTDLTPSKFYERVWCPTLPVMHLAIALQSYLLTTDTQPKFFDLVLSPDWVTKAVNFAEMMRPTIPGTEIRVTF